MAHQQILVNLRECVSRPTAGCVDFSCIYPVLSRLESEAPACQSDGLKDQAVHSALHSAVCGCIQLYEAGANLLHILLHDSHH